LRLHPLKKQAAQAAAEVALTFRPVEAVAAERRAGRGEVLIGETEGEAETAAQGRQIKAVGAVGQETARREALVEPDTQSTGEVVVAEPGFAQGRVAGAEAAAVGAGLGGGGLGEGHHRLDQAGDIGAGETEVFVAALALGGEEACVEKFGRMFRRAGLGKAGGLAKLGDCAGAAVHQEHHHARAGRIGKRRGEAGDVGAFGHGARIAGLGAGRHGGRFGPDRTVAPPGQGRVAGGGAAWQQGPRKGDDMAIPIHELAALGTATCWAMTGIIASDAIRVLGAFHFNLIRQVFVTLILAAVVLASGTLALPGWQAVAVLAVSGVVGILLGDTLNFAAVGRLGPRRAGAVFALNAPMAALLGWLVLGERLGWQAGLGIVVTVAGVALAIMGRPASGAHRLEQIWGGLGMGVMFGLAAALGQAVGALIARPYMAGGLDPYVGSLIRVGASGLAMGMATTLPFAPPRPRDVSGKVLILTGLTALIGLLLGMTLFLYALQGSQTGIIATLSATSPVIILPLLWLRTGQRPSALSWAGGALAVLGLTLIFTR
jgi:drug/metabolite transporter (DMT)-like permease